MAKFLCLNNVYLNGRVGGKFSKENVYTFTKKEEVEAIKSLPNHFQEITDAQAKQIKNKQKSVEDENCAT